MLMNGQVKASSAKETETKVSMVKDYEQESDVGMAAEEESDYSTREKSKPQMSKFEKTALGGHIINMHYSEGFGRTHLMKLLHLTEYGCKLPLETEYFKYAAGPYNEDLVRDIEEDLKRFNHYSIRQAFHTDKRKVTYRPAISARELEGIFKETFSNQAEQSNSFLFKFQGKSWSECEVVSTLYAVWNNRIIRKQTITDDLLKEDFLAWDPQKAKYAGQLDESLQWMRDNEVVPDGWGKVIEGRKTK